MSGGADQSIGMMDSAYFVGRKEILDWVNATCQTNLAKIEQTCNGALACQILDAIYPNSLPMSKVDWSANKDYEFIHNYKLLQKAFTTLKIDKHIEVDRLIRGKYQDNLEFMQWFKKFYELNAPAGVEYDAVGQRNKGKGGALYSSKNKATAAPAAASGGAPRKRPSQPARPTGTDSKDGKTTPTGTTKTVEARTTKTATASRRTPPGSEVTAPPAPSTAVIATMKKENEDLTTANAELLLMIEGVEKERDFYFGKLRDIEVLLQQMKDAEKNELAQSIFKILYATEEEFSAETAETAQATTEEAPKTENKTGANEDETF